MSETAFCASKAPPFEHATRACLDCHASASREGCSERPAARRPLPRARVTTAVGKNGLRDAVTLAGVGRHMGAREGSR